jgi:hypothetical protein
MQRSALLREIFDVQPAAPGAEWIRIDSGSTGCVASLSQGNDETLIGVEAATAGGTTVYLPHVSVATGFFELNHTDTRVAIVNPGTSGANVIAQLFDMDGGLRGSVNLSIPAGGSRNFRSSETFGEFMADSGLGGKLFDGYIRLLSNVPIAAWQRIETPLSRSLLRGRTAEEIQPTTLAILPHFVFGAEYGSFLNLINPTNAPLNLELTAVDSKGASMGETINLTLAPGQNRRSSIGEFFRVAIIAIYPPPLISGYVRIREARGGPFQIVGDTEIFATNRGATRGASMLYPISAAAATSWTIPFAASEAGFFTGYSVANPNEMLAVQTDVQVEVVSPAGNVIAARSVSLSPRFRESALIPSGVASGYLRFTSNFPIHILSSIGTRSGQFLDYLPAIRQ